MRKIAALLFIFGILGAAEQQGSEVQEWLDNEFSQRDLPKWTSSYLIDLDGRIKDEEAHLFFRRFLADPGTHRDNMLKVAEYFILLGYKDHEGDIRPGDVYKAIYYGVTYTLIDGLPSGPTTQNPPPIPSENQNH